MPNNPIPVITIDGPTASGKGTVANRVAERLGFRPEGTRRESHWITDRFEDHVIYGLLESEWRPGPPDAG